MEQHSGCHVERHEKATTPEERSDAAIIKLAIRGMGCQNCANRVRNSLLRLKGVVEAAVDFRSGSGFVQFNPTMLNESQLIEAVASAGGDGRHEYLARIAD